MRAQRGAPSGLLVGQLEAVDGGLSAVEHLGVEGHGLRGDEHLVGVASGDDQHLAVGVVGIGAHGHGGGVDVGQVEPGGQIGRAVGDDDRIALGHGADVDRETHRAALGDHAEVAGDDAGGLDGLERGAEAKTMGMLSGWMTAGSRNGMGSCLRSSARGSRSPWMSRKVLRWTRAQRVVLAGSSQTMV